MKYKQGMELLDQLRLNMEVLARIVPQNQAQILLVRDTLESNIRVKNAMLDTVKPDIYTITAVEYYHDRDRDNYDRDTIREVHEYEADSEDALMDTLVDKVVTGNLSAELSKASYMAMGSTGWDEEYFYYEYKWMRCNGEAFMRAGEIEDKIKIHPRYVQHLEVLKSRVKEVAKELVAKSRASRLQAFRDHEAVLKKEGILP